MESKDSPASVLQVTQVPPAVMWTTARLPHVSMEGHVSMARPPTLVGVHLVTREGTVHK